MSSFADRRQLVLASTFSLSALTLLTVVTTSAQSGGVVAQLAPSDMLFTAAISESDLTTKLWEFFNERLPFLRKQQGDTMDGPTTTPDTMEFSNSMPTPDSMVMPETMVSPNGMGSADAPSWAMPGDFGSNAPFQGIPTDESSNVPPMATPWDTAPTHQASASIASIEQQLAVIGSQIQGAEQSLAEIGQQKLVLMQEYRKEMTELDTGYGNLSLSIDALRQQAAGLETQRRMLEQSMGGSMPGGMPFDDGNMGGDDDIQCPTIFNPVCGWKGDGQGITYGNSCEAERDGAWKWSPGAC